MKYINKLLAFLSVFVLLLLVVSCNSDNDIEPLFDQSINERTQALKTEYSNVLVSPENGWVGYYSPNDNFGFYTILLDFDSNGNVAIKSDYDLGSVDSNITYRIDKTLKLELVFESTSVFSEIFSLNDNNNQGEFVFNILSATQNEIVLESKLDFGSDVTILNLRRARPEELDLAPVFTSVKNISDDERQGLFSNILFNDIVIGKFSFNPITRFATVSYQNPDQTITVVNAPIIITPTGFVFVEPLNINGVTLTSFEFNEAENEYQNPADALRIIYDNIPYLFGVTDQAAVYNIDEPFKSSPLFNAFFQNFSRDISRTNGLEGLQITNIVFQELNTQEIPYLLITTNFGNVFYDINFDFDEETGIVKFALTGETNSSDFFTNLIQPLLDIVIDSIEGYYVVGSGTGITFENTTFTLINIDNPDYKIDFWTFSQ